jgi:multidrug efflux pump subunit AcrA (membrane-fusion protein)
MGDTTDATSEDTAYTAPATQEDLDKIIADRLKRERERTTKRYADYDDLKAKAQRLDQQEQSAKTDLQLAQERAEAAEAKAAALEQEQKVRAWTDEVAGKHKVPAAALRGSTLEDLEAHAATLKPLLTPQGEPEKKTPKGAIGPYVPGEGKTPDKAKGTTADQFAAFIQQQFN